MFICLGGYNYKMHHGDDGSRHMNAACIRK